MLDRLVSVIADQQDVQAALRQQRAWQDALQIVHRALNRSNVYAKALQQLVTLNVLVRLRFRQAVSAGQQTQVAFLTVSGCLSQVLCDDMVVTSLTVHACRVVLLMLRRLHA